MIISLRSGEITYPINNAASDSEKYAYKWGLELKMIFSPAKWFIDYSVKPRGKPDGAGVDLANSEMSMNSYVDIADEEALRLREQVD